MSEDNFLAYLLIAICVPAMFLLAFIASRNLAYFCLVTLGLLALTIINSAFSRRRRRNTK